MNHSSKEQCRITDLAGSFAVEGSEGVVRYRGVNRGQEPCFFAELPVDARFKVYPNTAYCSLSQDGTHVDLILGDSPLPLDRDVEFGVRAFFVKVPQGGLVTGEIRLALPFQEWSGYFLPHRLIKTEVVTVRHIVLHIDVIPQSAVTWARPAKAAPDRWSVGGPVTRCSVGLRLEVPIPVAKRGDNFPRSAEATCAAK